MDLNSCTSYCDPGRQFSGLMELQAPEGVRSFIGQTTIVGFVNLSLPDGACSE